MLMLAALALSGCSSITNLTPTRLPRSENGFYRVEAKWKSNVQAVREDSFKPEVVVGLEKYPMRPVPVVEDRWEAYIPVPADEAAVVYHYQFDFMKNGFRQARPESKKSADYTLKIVPKK
ncbi:MAG TPA: hypothetical protein VHB20_16180 [Verrucomicrobiae bacterium]|jgi:hypothetical protein|nr:hypothetical protein [Verrucomicrobiae bacterium]